MESHVWWTPLELPGLEQLHLVENETGVVADGLVLGIEGATPFRLWYQVWTDHDWYVRECLLQVGGEQGQSVHLYTDGQGHWTDAEGIACSTLDGCLDLDISRTPFTNTLPVRRLALTPGESADLLVAYMTVPDLSIRPVQQRYTCLSLTASGGIYRYEGVGEQLYRRFARRCPGTGRGLSRHLEASGDEATWGEQPLSVERCPRRVACLRATSRTSRTPPALWTVCRRLGCRLDGVSARERCRPNRDR